MKALNHKHGWRKESRENSGNNKRNEEEHQNYEGQIRLRSPTQPLHRNATSTDKFDSHLGFVSFLKAEPPEEGHIWSIIEILANQPSKKGNLGIDPTLKSLNVNLICEKGRILEMWNLWPKVRASAEEDKKEKRRNKSKETSPTWTKLWSSKAKANEKGDNVFSPTTVQLFLLKLLM